MKREKFIPTYIDRKRSLVLLFILLGIYLYSSSRVKLFIDNSVDIYLIRPLMWGGLLWLGWKMPKLRGESKSRFKGSICMWAFIFGLIYILSLLGVGMFMGLGKSPYGHDFNTILMNGVMFGIPLVGREVVRYHMIANTKEKYKWLVILLSGLVMAFFMEELSRYFRLNGIKSITMFFGNYGMENISTSLMASYLAYIGGVVPSLIYMGMILGFEFISPILPDLQWLVKALLSTIIPLFSFMMMQEIYSKESKDIDYQREKKTAKKESTVGWLATVILSIGIVWFSLGVFPIYPQVIATGSMEPMIKPGDVVIYRKVDNESVKKLEKDDIIHFKRDGITITHRIIEVQEVEGMRCYLTRGDNNSDDDGTPVQMNDIKGTCERVIPKIGWPTLLLKQDDGVKKEGVEF